MYHYMEFDPYSIGERNRRIFEEVQALRLEQDLRKSRKGRSPSRLVALVLRLEGVLRRTVVRYL